VRHREARTGVDWGERCLVAAHGNADRGRSRRGEAQRNSGQVLEHWQSDWRNGI
jgi:hypothetical protein